MTFTVVWTQTALDDLALIWINALDRQGVTDACNRIDRELQMDADQKGQDIFGDRYYVDPPLAVVCEVSPDDRLVRVQEVMFVGY